jgi:uncharacterized spore protein YtfJ
MKMKQGKIRSIGILGGVLWGGLLFAGAGPAGAEEAALSAQNAHITTLVSQIKTVLNADSVLGSVREFEGKKIIPIVSIGFGFGAGSGRSAETGDQGAGGGGGGGIMPTGILVITEDGDIHIMPARKGMLSEILEGALPPIIEAMMEKEQESAEEPSKTEESAEPQ